MSSLVLLILISGAIGIYLFVMLILILIKFSINATRKYSEPFNPIESPDRPNIVTFISVGHASSHANATKYAGKKGVPIIYNNEVITIRDKFAPTIIHNIYPYPEDVDIDYGYSPHLYILIQNIPKLLYCYRRNYMPPLHYCRYTQVDLGGKNDVKHHLKYFREMLKTIKDDEKVVIFGYCKGGATSIVAITEMTPEEQSKISLVIIENIYTDILSFSRNSTAITNMIGNKNALFVTSLLSIVSNFSFQDKSPIGVINSFPNDIPIGFIGSKNDEHLGTHHMEKMVNLLRENGHENVHMCVLDKANHSETCVHNLEDQQKYLNFVNMLYDRYT
jgi:hypothetical protein